MPDFALDKNALKNTVGISGDFLGTTDSQTLTNKTLTTPSQSSYEDFARISIPSNPAANMGRVYVKQIDTNNDGLFILLKKAGAYVEVQIA